ncbi:cytochrome P450 4V2-like [Argonauta hians]
MRMSEEFQDGIFCIWIGNQPVILVYKDDYVQDVIGNTRHIKKSFVYDFLHPWIGNGLLTSTGARWFKHRKMLTPSFHYNILNSFQYVIKKQSDIFCDKLEEMIGKGEFDIEPFIGRYTLDVITETAMGKCVNVQHCKYSQYLESVKRVGDIITKQMVTPWLWPSFLFNLHPWGREMAKCIKYLHDFTNEVIDDRMKLYLDNLKNKSEERSDESSSKKLAFLDTLIDKLHGGEIDKKSLREEVDTFMFEGHDTTSSGISFTLYLIASHPDVQRRLQEEIDAFYGDNKETTLVNVKTLSYLDSVIKESHRLYPPVPMMGRIAAEDFKIGPYKVKKDTPITVMISSLHRDPRNFPDPHIFNPDRFLIENADRKPYAFIPFSAGPRNCIGQKFASLEEHIVITRIIHKFHLESTQPMKELEPSLSLVLKPSNGIRIKLSYR